MVVLKLQLFFTILTLVSFASSSNSQHLSIFYNGFNTSSSNIFLDGIARITPAGVLELTNSTVEEIGHAFYPDPVVFKKSSSLSSSSFSFSTSFVFAIQSEVSQLSGYGVAFVIAPEKDLPDALPGQYLGLFNNKNRNRRRNHIVAVEFDDIYSFNHVGIDINGLDSEVSKLAGYYGEDGSFHNVSMISEKPMQVWIEYNSSSPEIDVTLAPVDIPKPNKPLLSLQTDLSRLLKQRMYVGFSSSTGSVYLLGWSFRMNGAARMLDLSKLPELPRVEPKMNSNILTIHLCIFLILLSSIATAGLIHYLRMKRNFAEEVLEDWESEYGPRRFKYKDLYIATKGFRNKELLGSGGFGRVYRGVLPCSKVEVAVKRVSHESRQGIKEFVAEIVSIGRLRHRNLVPLLGYCRLKGELMLVYEYMPNGSLDRFLYNQPRTSPDQTLTWNQRFQVIQGVAWGLFYLHEGWEQIVIHRDVKAGNVLLDDKFNAKLGDFGLSRLYDHGTDPHTTHVMGTFGYLAPEHNRTGKATTSTDVYSFGAFLLEVVCGRRPIEPRDSPEDSILLDRVVSCWNKGEMLEAVDPRMGDYVKEEVEMVMKLGLLCSHCEPDQRPSMRHVVLYLDGAVALPELPSIGVSAAGLRFANEAAFCGLDQSFSSYMERRYSHVSCISHSIMFEGR